MSGSWKFLSARRALERKKGAEHDLLAIEVQAVGLGEEARDLLPYLNPLIKAAASGEAAHRLMLARNDLGRSAFCPLAAHGEPDHAGEELGQQLDDGAIRFIGLGAGKLVGEAVQRHGVELGQAAQQLEEAAVE